MRAPTNTGGSRLLILVILVGATVIALAPVLIGRGRWVRAMRETDVPMRLIAGPIDPNSGAHMARRYAEVIPNADVIVLADDIGHWPQLEAPESVLTHFLAHIDRVTAGS